MIITEHMDTNLESLLRRHGSSISFEKRLRILRDCALGLNWLHCSTPPIVHGDVRLNKVLISSRSVDQLLVKVCQHDALLHRVCVYCNNNTPNSQKKTNMHADQHTCREHKTQRRDAYTYT
jgi:Protein tyrosine and serine/threonine kinase